MVRQPRGIVIMLGIFVLFSGSWLEGCRRPRPNNIPRDSVYVEGGEAGWWQHCSYDPNQDADYCQIFNLSGEIIEDEIFLPDDGGRAAKASELDINGNALFSGPYIVCLRNGRILIPKSDFDNQKRGIDSRLKGR